MATRTTRNIGVASDRLVVKEGFDPAAPFTWIKKSDYCSFEQVNVNYGVQFVSWMAPGTTTGFGVTSRRLMVNKGSDPAAPFSWKTDRGHSSFNK